MPLRPSLLLPVLGSLAACAAPPAPVLETTDTVRVERSRDMLRKGRIGGLGTVDPSVERWTYSLDCAREAQGGPVEARADGLIAALPAAVGQVTVQIGPHLERESELRRVNHIAVPQYACQARDLRRQTIASGQTEFLSAAIRLGALPELTGRR
ncbi:MAG: hypothetical protein ACK4YU_13725 [Paracoccus sp. (in: a-proteobacteria)]